MTHKFIFVLFVGLFRRSYLYNKLKFYEGLSRLNLGGKWGGKTKGTKIGRNFASCTCFVFLHFIIQCFIIFSETKVMGILISQSIIHFFLIIVLFLYNLFMSYN